jgi:hypothetical protein
MRSHVEHIPDPLALCIALVALIACASGFFMRRGHPG